MIFDSGASKGRFGIDSTFFASHPHLALNVLHDTTQTGSAWSDYRVSSLTYNVSQTVKIGNANLIYDFVQIANWKKAIQNDNCDGLFNISPNDTIHVWELNFEYNYLEIHPEENYRMPENCFLFPFKKGIIGYSIQLPLQITCANGDTLTLDRTYLVDTGMAWDIALISPAEELEFFNKREDAVWTQYLDGYYRHYTVKTTLLNNVALDSVRIYTFDNPYSLPCKYLVGQNFLKRFNVFFDMKNSQLGLQPIKNFQRIVNPNHRRFHYWATKNSKSKYIVTKLADYKGNYYKRAGLQTGDEIVAVNDTLYKNISYEQYLDFYKQDTLMFNIIREGKPMQIIIPVDKNEEQGD
jgi:hypothetical protein